MTNPSDADGLVVLGRVAGLFGIQGWVKIHSYTRPREGILEYNPWLLNVDNAWREIAVAHGRIHGSGIIVSLEGFSDRNMSQALVGCDIAVPVTQLPALPGNEFYWAQLEGLRVRNLEGIELGRVSHLFETGANDVMVVQGERERLLPFTENVIRRVDIAAGVIVVDWDANF